MLRIGLVSLAVTVCLVFRSFDMLCQVGMQAERQWDAAGDQLENRPWLLPIAHMLLDALERISVANLAVDRVTCTR